MVLNLLEEVERVRDVALNLLIGHVANGVGLLPIEVLASAQARFNPGFHELLQRHRAFECLDDQRHGRMAHDGRLRLGGSGIDGGEKGFRRRAAQFGQIADKPGFPLASITEVALRC